MHVVVMAANAPALRFYDRLGFRRLDVAEPGPVVYLGLALLPPGQGEGPRPAEADPRA